MIHAFFMMNNVKGRGQKRYINSTLFEQSKLKFSEAMTGRKSPLLGRKVSEKHLANIIASRKRGKDNPLYGKPRTEEHKIKMCKPKHEGHGEAVSLGRMGMKFTKEHIKNLSEAHMGQVAWNKGKTLSDDHKKKLSKSAKNKNKKYITDEYRKRQSDNTKRVWEERRKIN